MFIALLQKKKRDIINEFLHVPICSVPVNYSSYSKRVISIFIIYKVSHFITF